MGDRCCAFHRKRGERPRITVVFPCQHNHLSTIFLPGASLVAADHCAQSVAPSAADSNLVGSTFEQSVIDEEGYAEICVMRQTKERTPPLRTGRAAVPFEIEEYYDRRPYRHSHSSGAVGRPRPITRPSRPATVVAHNARRSAGTIPPRASSSVQRLTVRRSGR